MSAIKKWFTSKVNVAKEYFINSSQIKVLYEIQPKKAKYILFFFFLEDGRLVVSSTDEHIYIYSQKDKKFQLDFKFFAHKHGGQVLCRYKTSQFFSAREEIKLWEITKSSAKCIFLIYPEPHCSLCNLFLLSNNRLLLTAILPIKIWNLNQLYNYEMVKEIKINSFGSLYLEDKEILITGIEDCKKDEISIFSMKTYQLICRFQGVSINHHNSIIRYDKNKVVVLGREKFAMVNITKFCVEWVVKTPVLIFTSVIQVSEDILIAGSLNKYFIKCNIKTKEYSLIRGIHHNPINIIKKLDDNLFISSARSIKIWTFHNKD